MPVPPYTIVITTVSAVFNILSIGVNGCVHALTGDVSLIPTYTTCCQYGHGRYKYGRIWSNTHTYITCKYGHGRYTVYTCMGDVGLIPTYT